MNTIERIRELVKEKDTTIAALCRKMGVSKGYFTEAQAKGRELSDERIEQIAEILDTTPEYLRGETEQKEKPSTGGELSDKQKDCLQIFSSLSIEDQTQALRYLQFLASNGQNQ